MIPYYFGPWSGSSERSGEKNEALFSLHPIVVVVEVIESESRSVTLNKMTVKGFGDIRTAQAFVDESCDPDKAPAKAGMFAFRNGEWEYIDAVAE